MNNIFLGKKTRNQLAEIEEKNSDTMIFWSLPNVVFPVIVVVISSVCYILFKPVSEFTWLGWLNLFFNGSLPLIALNRLSSLGVNIFKYNKAQENVYKINTEGIRTTLLYYTIFLVLFIVIQYVHQVINNPISLSWWILLQFVISIIFIYESLHLSKNAYLLQEKMLERTIGDEIKEGAQEKKKHLSQKYGEEEQ